MDHFPNISLMQLQVYSQLLKLDLANDQLLQMYYVLYYDLPKEEIETTQNVGYLIEIREKIKLELRGHLFNIRNSIKEYSLSGLLLGFLPVYLKLEFLARNTFYDANWESCYEKERKNIKLYYETLYNQNIPAATIDVLLRQKRNLESLPK